MAQHAWEHHVVAGAEIVRRISDVWPLEAIGGRPEDPAPADRYRFFGAPDGADDLTTLFRAAVWTKLPGHCVSEPSLIKPVPPRSRIGG
ncbi:MAG: hypothetical protein M3083_03475 [Actinomycetota bacterium]|nr:hypothetical protein [Actinomycetota bacterium]MDQ6947856.1 hypothetical protein [Actinomycetota bacterium]